MGTKLQLLKSKLMALMLSSAGTSVDTFECICILKWFQNTLAMFGFFVESQKRGSGKQGETLSMIVLFLHSHKWRCSMSLGQSI